MSESNLAFFNDLAGRLEFDLSEPPQAVDDMAVQLATPDARLRNLRLDLKVFVEDLGDERELTAEEWERPVLGQAQVSLRSLSGDLLSHSAPNGEFFTVRELMLAIEETERRTREKSDWFGGLDLHHCFFEGIYPDEEVPEAWEIYWGS